MSEADTTQGLVMLIVGVLMVAATAVLLLTTSETSSVYLGIIGLVFIGVGSRKHRAATRH